MNRMLFIPLLSAAVCGCGGGGSTASPTSLKGSFGFIENGLVDLHSTVSDANYSSSSRDLGSDSDLLGSAINSFVKAASGSPLAADAEEIRKKFSDLEQLVAAGAPVEKQREAVKALQATVAAAKAKL